MNTFWRGWQGRILLLGTAGLLLQQVPVEYTLLMSSAGFGKDVQGASLVHLHAGLSLAIAMLDRDRRVLLGCSLMLLAGWMLRAWLQDYAGPIYVWGAINAAAVYLWTLLCAHGMGWPQPADDMRVERTDLPRMFVIGLVLYPLGTVLSWALINVTEDWHGQIKNSIQLLFAKQFGTVIVAFPLVIAWAERRRTVEAMSGSRLRWGPLLALFLGGSIWMNDAVQAQLYGQAERGVVLMDYRFTLFAALGWCMLHLRPLYAMPLLSFTMFAMVFSLSDTAELGATPLGFMNLVHLAVELSILLVAMLYFHLTDRDARDFSARLVEETLRDATTRLPNLNALTYRLLRLPPGKREIACLLLDKTDALAPGFGLATQTRLMNAVAGRMADLVEPYYIGTGQFALLPLDERTGADAWLRLVARIEQFEFDNDDQPIRLLPYLGVAEYMPGNRESVDFALLNASYLAHEAKRRNELHPLYASDRDPADHIGERLYEAAEALSCLRSERVVLHFQTIQRLSDAPADGGIHGEVLCRLRKAEGALLMPDRFMRAIEGAGRGVELDLAVLRTLFAWLRKHPQAVARAGRIAVNLTGQSLASASFRSQLYAMLDKSPLPLSRLCFEVIETAAIVSPAEASEFLGELRRRGCSIAIDDFGVGMQSFERLKELPVDLIKIDGSFIRNVAQRGKDYALVQASVAVARAFGAMTVAEYVENEETVVCLRELGIDWIQGYLVSKPVPIEDAFAIAE